MVDGVIPDFEGRPVARSVVKMTGKTPLDELSDIVISVDDRVQLLAMMTVVGVRHEVDKKDGELVRVHLVSPVEMNLAPIDGTSDGILRAIPQAQALSSRTLSDEGDDDD